MKNKIKKIKVRFCPKCGGTKIIMKAGGQMGMSYCLKCGFTCVVFPEKYIVIRDKMKNKKS